MWNYLPEKWTRKKDGQVVVKIGKVQKIGYSLISKPQK